ncbi:MAG: peptidoglycan-binding domain-containing protein [Solirubrobacterales bacterium]
MKPSIKILLAAMLSNSALAADLPPYGNAEPEHGFAASLAPAYITDLQQQLVARGYYAGPVDGRMNNALRAAVSVYQSDVGLKVTGVPDLAVVNMLRFGPDVRATIQPLGAPAKPAVAAAPTAQRAGVPPYEKIEPYRHPNQAAAAEAAVEESEPADTVRCEGAVNVLKPPARPDRQAARGEPPAPKAAPQAKVVSQPLYPAVR